ncbi:MAG: recombinase family protein [Proteocatella sp.]
MKLGYCRVSSKDQNEDRQLLKMRELGIEEKHIYIDKQSGKDFNRQQYQIMRNTIRKGDIVYFDSLDRLGRFYEGVLDEWKYITRELEADIVCLDNEALFDSRKFKQMDSIDEKGNRTGYGKLLEDQFLSLLAYVAEAERNKIRTRQQEGIDLWKATGKTKTNKAYGRPATEVDERAFNKVYRQYKDGVITVADASRLLKITRQTFYRKVKKIES